jgi:hypothetical protein
MMRGAANYLKCYELSTQFNPLEGICKEICHISDMVGPLSH